MSRSPRGERGLKSMLQVQVIALMKVALLAESVD